MQGGVECLYEFNLLHHVSVVAKKVCAAAAEPVRQYPFGPNGPRGKNWLLAIYIFTKAEY